MKRLSPSSRASGFSLFEIIVVMSIMVLIIGIGYASFSDMTSEDPFEKPTQSLAQMSKYALNTAVIQHRGMLIGFDKTGFGVVGTSAEGMSNYALPADMKMLIKHWGDTDWQKAEGQVWHFGEQGVCDFVTVRFEMKDGNSHEVKFHPLTGGITE
jgi:prepilin-type N-terminal cleavage/methylation domain-containing protein